MHINTDKKAVFYHVMKTGGTSLHLMLESPGELLGRLPKKEECWNIIMGMHGSYSVLKNKHPKEFEMVKDYYKFMFVRNPWSHAVSLYFHTTSPERFDKEVKMGSNGRRAEREDFKSFKYYLKYLYKPQEESTFDDPNFMNDEAYFFEDYENEVLRLFKRFDYSNNNFKSKVIHKNRSSVNIFGFEYPKKYKVMFDQECIDIVAEKSKRYIDKFNYQFE